MTKYDYQDGYLAGEKYGFKLGLAWALKSIEFAQKNYKGAVLMKVKREIAEEWVRLNGLDGI